MPRSPVWKIIAVDQGLPTRRKDLGREGYWAYTHHTPNWNPDPKFISKEKVKALAERTKKFHVRAIRFKGPRGKKQWVPSAWPLSWFSKVK